MTATPLPACCLSCAFFHEGTSPAFPDAEGMCRRYAPQGPAQSHQQGWQVFPPMMKHHWCGDYRERSGLAEAWAAAAREAA